MSVILGIPNLLAQADGGGAPSWWDQLWWGGKTDASTFTAGSDAVFFYVFWVSAAFFVVLMTLMVYWVIKYKRVPGTVAQPSPSHHTQLEIAWSVIPTILMAVMFFWGFKEYMIQRVAPADAEIIRVTAQQWSWSLEYDNGATPLQTVTISDNSAPVFALPLDRPVKFTMTSKDVIHSMYFPAFRVKRDVFPNMYTHLWVQATKRSHQYVKETDSFEPLDLAKKDTEGEGYYLTCAEYCGDQHSQMWGRAMVLDSDDYQVWKEKQASTEGIDLLVLGEMLHKAKGCIACHSTEGARGTGPSWKGIWMSQEAIRDGTTVTVDENYIRESILEPAAKIVNSFQNQMTSYQGQLTDREIFAIITFIKSLGDEPTHQQEAQDDSDNEAAEREAAKAAGAEEDAS